jgi:hypothetical protein
MAKIDLLSDKLHALITEREDWGRSKEVREEAIYHLYGNEYNVDEIGKFLYKLNSLGLITSDLTIDRIRGLVFLGSEKEVLERLSKIKRVEKQTPKWMVVKMISNRLSKIYGSEKRYSHMDKTAKLTREKVTPGDIKEWTDYYYPDHCRKAARELVRILNRADVTEQMINEAWDQLEVMGVMSS